MRGTLAAENVTKEYGSTTVLERLSLAVPPGARLGVVGPNGSGKSTLLRILAGIDEPDSGRVVAPPGLRVAYLPQEPERRDGETLLAALARRTGVADAESAMDALAARLQREPELATAYTDALERFLALGGDDFAPRARAAAADVGLTLPLDAELPTLSGGEAARVSLAALLLMRYDVLCLDEPTNDLDFDGLARLERFVREFDGALVIVSHDRAFLDGTVNRILAFDPETRRVREFAGTYSDFERERELGAQREQQAYSDYVEERDRFTSLLSERRTEARAGGAKADSRGTNALSGKISQASRRLERLDRVEKPWRPWRLQLDLSARLRGGDVVARLSGAVVERGSFRLGPIDVEVLHGDRVAFVGPNGAGKTTLLHAITGELPLAAGRREVGPGTVFGELDQRRELFDSDAPLLDTFCAASSLRPPDARTLLAKFGLSGEDVLRGARTLSPGERSRAVLALLQSRGVNCLVLDEPTNHLDLEAIEQLEQALADYEGTVLLVTHDRRFLERFAPTRELSLRSGSTTGSRA